MLAQSGHGGRFGQMSSKPRSSGGLSPKYSNSSLPVDLGGGGLLGSLSEVGEMKVLEISGVKELTEDLNVGPGDAELVLTDTVIRSLVPPLGQS